MTDPEMKKVQNRFYKCCKNGNLDELKYLVSIGADTSDDDNRPLCVAVTHNHLEIVKYLLENDADITGDVVDCAIRLGDLKMIKYLSKFSSYSYFTNQG